MTPSFAAERTLGKLAAWLRLLGFDAILETRLPKGSFPERIGPGRILLTRTRRVANQTDAVLITSNAPIDQLRELVCLKLISAAEIKPFTRCLRCNDPIERVPRDSVRGVVPDYVWETQGEFSRCPGCSRVYWHGSHTRRSLKKIDDLFIEFNQGAV